MGGLFYSASRVPAALNFTRLCTICLLSDTYADGTRNASPCAVVGCFLKCAGFQDEVHKTMGRPKKTSSELILSHARIGRIRARQREERKNAIAQQSDTENKQRFLAAITEECETFASRCTDKTLCTDLEGNLNNQGPWLERALGFAKRVATEKNPSHRCKRLATRFLHDLKNGASSGIYFDPCAVENIPFWCDAFGIDGHTYLDSDTFVLAAFLGFKKRNGTRRFCKSWTRLSYAQKHVLDAGISFLAQHAAAR
jgi:hypothetical protein